MNTFSSNFDKLKSEIEKIFITADFELEGSHSKDTLEWVLRIDKDADEALQIAALAHDIDRGVASKILIKDGETYEEYKQRHAKRSASLISDLMSKYGYGDKIINKTKSLVENHEIGGDRETDILMDADSISFFSCNLEWYLGYKGEEGTKKKVELMYNRATPRARQIIKSIAINNKILKKICKQIIK